MDQHRTIVEITAEEDEPEVDLAEFTELLEVINSIYVSIYENQKQIEAMDLNLLEYRESEFRNQNELHRFVGQLQESGILEDIRGNARKWAPPRVDEGIQIRKLQKQSPVTIELAGLSIPLLVTLWLAYSVEAEYSVTEEYGPDEELENKTIEKRIAYNVSSISELLEILKRRFK